MERWRLVIFAACLLIGWVDAFGQGAAAEPVELPWQPSRSWLLLRRDATSIVTSPLRWDAQTWGKVGIGVGAVAAIMLADDRIREEVLRHSDGPLTQFADLAEPFGSDYSWIVLGGFYSAGRMLDNPRASAIAEDGLVSSLIAAGMITPALKALSGRSRPSESPREFQFHNQDGSFPSGHTTQAFAVASVIAAHYDSPWIDGLVYGLAGLVGYARIAHNAHFASDVIAGAAIGVAVGKAVVRLNNEHRRLSLEPMITRDGAGVSIRLALDR